MDDELREAERQGDAPRFVALWRRSGWPPPAGGAARGLWLRGVLDELDRSVDEDERERAAYDRDDSIYLPRPPASQRTVALRDEVTSIDGALEALTEVALEDPVADDRIRRRATAVLCELASLPAAVLRRLAASPDRAVHERAYRRLERSGASPDTLREVIAGWSTSDLLRSLTSALLEDGPALSPDGYVARIALVRDVLRGRELTPLLDDPEPRVRRDALLELLVQRDQGAWAPLARVVTTHPDLHARIFGWNALLTLDRARVLDLALSVVSVAPPVDDPVAVDAFQDAASLLVDAADARARSALAITVARGGALGDWVAAALRRWSADAAERRLEQRVGRVPTTIWSWRRCGETLERMAEKAVRARPPAAT